MIKFLVNLDLSNYTLIVPCVSVGNTGQLAADLLISSMKMQKIATLWSPAIVPVIGLDPYNLDSNSLMVSCELYANESKKLVVLQLRSPLVKKYSEDFLTNVANLINKYNMDRIIILSSSFASELRNIDSVPFRYMSNEFIKNRDQFCSLKWLDYNNEVAKDVIHGGGFAKQLHEICTRLKIPCLVLFKYCSEGDNVPDAVDMVTYLNNYVQFSDISKDIQQSLVYPPSWNLLFGNPPPRDIY